MLTLHPIYSTGTDSLSVPEFPGCAAALDAARHAF
jgi:hypothetical protein